MNNTQFKNWYKRRKLKPYLNDGNIFAKYGEAGLVMYIPSAGYAICMGIECKELRELTRIYNDTVYLSQPEALRYVLVAFGKFR